MTASAERRAGRRLRAVASAALLAVLTAGCSAPELPQASAIRPVRCERVVSVSGGRVRTFSGSARAGVESHLSFRVAGSIRAIHVKVGDHVEADALLAELDPKDYELQVQEVAASLARAEAEARNAAANYERVRALYESRNASRNDLDTARAHAEGGAAAVRSLQKRLELVELQLSYTKLSASVAGAIAAVSPEINENVAAGEPVIMLTSGDRAEVEVGMPEVLISGVRQQDSVSVRFSALPGREFPATITKVGVSSLGAATTFPVTVRLDEPDPAVRPGMAADVSFVFYGEGEGERILVPPVAVGEDEDGRFVFVVEPTGEPPVDGARLAVASRREVVVGDLSEDGLHILDGLVEGELLATAGVRRLADGQVVKLLEQ